ncbi:acyl carrier protein [uncultured Clostridium sp.]|nr:acyl carrier protein [uncultured Clostridium sp.]
MDLRAAEQQLKRLVLENTLSLERTEDISDETDLISDLNYDSIAAIQLIVDIENTFGIEVEDAYLSLEAIAQFGKLKSGILRQLEAKVEDQNE